MRVQYITSEQRKGVEGFEYCLKFKGNILFVEEVYSE